jgi:hypothetical protein
MKFTYFTVSIIIFSLASCSKKKEKSVSITNPISYSSICTDTMSISYAKTIQPILNTYCVKCHDAATAQNFTNYNGTLPFAKAGILEDCITGSNGEILMPPSYDAKLDSCSIKAVKKWIKEGCTNN